MFYLLLLVAGLALLIKGADLVVGGAAGLARGLNVSSLVVGLTVVAFGTSAPELFVNIAASISGDADIALGNGIGSNIANILLVLGVSALIRPLRIPKKAVWKAIPFCLLAAAILWVVAGDRVIDGYFFSAVSRSDGVVLLGFFAVFLVYAAGNAVPISGLPNGPAVHDGRHRAAGLKMMVGFCGLLFGGRMTVDGAVALAGMLSIPDRVIGLTVVALATSLPELITSIQAARRGESEIAVGCVVGSNIFNGFFVLGVSAVVNPLPFEPKSHVDMGVMAAASVLLFVFMFTGKERFMGRWEAGLALLIYCLYLGFLLFSVYASVGPL